MSRGPLRIVVEQTAPRRLEVAANAEVMALAATRAATEGVDVVVFPELGLTGYDLGRWARELALVPTAGPPLALPPEGPVIVLGHPERASDDRVFNVASAWRGERLLHRHRKAYLPTYGMFDEGRVFAPSPDGPRVFEIAPDWKAALLVCEELWHPALPYLAGLQAADLLVVIAAGAGRGVGEAPSGGRFASAEAWTLLARSTALTHGLYVALANRAGSEGGVTFSGESLIVAPDGSVLAKGRADGDDRLSAELDPAELARVRDGFHHLRDEDPRLLLGELERLLGGSAEE